jgi:hypothetical protein
MAPELLVHQGSDGFWTLSIVQVTVPVGVWPKLGVKVAVLWKPEASFKKSTRSKTTSAVVGGVEGVDGAEPTGTQATFWLVLG